MIKRKINYKYASIIWEGVLKGEVYKFPSLDSADNKIVILDYLSVKIIPQITKAKLIIVKNYTGILSHAFILGREFKIPIILGTNDFREIKQGEKLKINIKENFFVRHKHGVGKN